MDQEREKLQQRYNEAIQAVEDISHERDLKGNANVTAGRYGELVANMVKYAESKMALDMLNNSSNFSPTNSLLLNPAEQELPSKQHVEPEALHGQNVINPT